MFRQRLFLDRLAIKQDPDWLCRGGMNSEDASVIQGAPARCAAGFCDPIRERDQAWVQHVTTQRPAQCPRGTGHIPQANARGRQARPGFPGRVRLHHPGEQRRCPGIVLAQTGRGQGQRDVAIRWSEAMRAVEPADRGGPVPRYERGLTQPERCPRLPGTGQIDSRIGAWGFSGWRVPQWNFPRWNFPRWNAPGDTPPWDTASWDTAS